MYKEQVIANQNSQYISIPSFKITEYRDKLHKYCLLIPVLNEGDSVDRKSVV